MNETHDFEEDNQMTWEEKSERAARERNPHVGALSKSIRTAEVYGARWQREELRSDETIERVVDVLERMDGLDLWDVACAAMSAALGEDDDDE